MHYIFGTQGFAKEVEFILYHNKTQEPIFFVCEDNSGEETRIISGRKVITETQFNKLSSTKKCYVAVGNPKIKEKIVNKLKKNTNNLFPNLLHSNVIYDDRFIKFGEGNIICSGVSLTTNITIGSFVHINLNSTVGHDTIIHDFVTISPSANVSGNVNINKKCYLGTNSTIIEKISIAEDSIIGAGCVVVKNIDVSGTYVGAPAKKIK